MSNLYLPKISFDDSEGRQTSDWGAWPPGPTLDRPWVVTEELG